MYPLETLLIGCRDDVLPELRRELTNLSVAIEGEYLDVRSCLTHVLANPAGKRLLVFCPNSAADIVQLERLNELVVGQPILALVDPANDPSLMVRAMRAGAAQVVRLPLQADDFRAAMNRIAIQFGHPLNQTRVILVLGVMEGSGTTSIAVNLASEIGRLRNAPCILAEGAVAFGRLANYLNIAPQVTSSDLVNDIDHVDVERVRRAITKVEGNLHVITGSYRGIVPVDLTAEKVFKLLNYAKQLGDVLVVDGRYTYEELDFEFLAQTQQLVLVAKPTVPSLYALRTLLDSLAQRECLAQQFVVINRFLPSAKEFSARSLEDVLRIPKVFTVAADYASFRAAENAGQTLRKTAPHSRSLADITGLARAMLGMPAEPPRVGWSFLDSWNRVAHAFSSK
jgi:pilus assembly protein CpaE